MNKFSVKSFVAAVAVVTPLSFAPVTNAEAGVTANVGVVSSYVFRGILQTDSSEIEMQGGADYSNENGIYAGIWGSTMDSEQAEYDIYFGWNSDYQDVNFNVGYTAYNYLKEVGAEKTRAFEEINLAVAYDVATLSLDLGKDNTETSSKDRYNHYALSVDLGKYLVQGLSVTYGTSVYDGTSIADGSSYFAIGFNGPTNLGFDFTANLISSGKKADDTTYFIVGVSKNFDLM